MGKAVIISTHPKHPEKYNLDVSDCFNKAATLKYVKRELRRRWPDVAERLQGNFKIELKGPYR